MDKLSKAAMMMAAKETMVIAAVVTAPPDYKRHKILVLHIWCSKLKNPILLLTINILTSSSIVLCPARNLDT